MLGGVLLFHQEIKTDGNFCFVRSYILVYNTVCDCEFASIFVNFCCDISIVTVLELILLSVVQHSALNWVPSLGKIDLLALTL